MRKTWLSVVTALVLIVLSGGLILARRYVLGAEIDGTPGTSAWRVSVEAEGQLTAPDGTVSLILPPAFRRQRIADETYDSAELAVRLRRSREAGPRRALWERRPGVVAADTFRLRYTCRCILGTRRPSAAMTYRSHTLDAAPADGALLRPSPRIESEADEVAHLAATLVPDSADAEDTVHLLYDHVAGLEHEDVPGPSSALSCLRAGRGDAGGKARLLVALCRQRRIPARLVTGLVLDDDDDGERPLHYWAEAWVDNRWLPMCPTFGRFGIRRIPDTYLVLSLGDNELVQGKNARVRPHWKATRLSDAFETARPAVPAGVRSAWRRLTLGNLRPEDQEWVKFLLLIPVGALVVSFYRTVIGITTFGTFGPALLGLVCRDLKVMPWALSTFVGIMLVGWVVRRQLDRYHLLLAPRVAALLTVVVIGLLFAVLATGSLGVVMGSYVTLLPLIIMTHMIERFWTVEAEDGTAASFKTLIGTVVVAVTVALVINIDVFINGAARLLRHGPLVSPGLVRMTLFRYPEALGLLLAAQFLIGRYTGYRLTELFRFRDLLIEEGAREASAAMRGTVSTGGRDGLAGTLPTPAGDGHSRNEPAEHRVHPGPEPTGPVSPGG